MAEAKTSTYRGYTEARKKANAKYISQFVEVKVRMEPDHRESVRAHAEAQGESLNGFINRAIDETMQRDGGADHE